MLDEFLHEPQIAYFSMGIALRDDIPTYARVGRAVMKGAIGKNASYFNRHRMMRRYATEAYIR